VPLWLQGAAKKRDVIPLFKSRHTFLPKRRENAVYFYEILVEKLPFTHSEE
jgi:hypothetical protein